MIGCLPIRLRLALAFALAAALVLLAIGALLALRLGATLEEVVDDGLVARAAELTPGLRGGDTTLREPVDPRERFAQLLGADGGVVSGTPGFERRPALDVDGLDQARTGQRVVLDRLPGLDGRARILVTRLDNSAGRRLVLLVGASLEDRDETVRSFVLELAVIGPIALVLVSLLGYALTTAALRPVESLRQQAAAISASEPGRRLTLPPARDDVHRLGETLNDMLGRLEAALERERGFVADASHELRTPLALLTTELELALRRPRSEAELEGALRSAAAEADRLARLADDLLMLARTDRGHLSLTRERIAARDLLERVAERLSMLASARGRQVTIEAPNPLTLDGDRILLEQALGNLLENALRHGDGAVTLRAEARESRVELHVVDTGPGFSQEFLPRAFDRFSRADEARTSEGSGLGLTIAAAIAAAHRGTIHAENRAGGGADVWLSVPATQTLGDP